MKTNNTDTDTEIQAIKDKKCLYFASEIKEHSGGWLNPDYNNRQYIFNFASKRLWQEVNSLSKSGADEISITVSIRYPESGYLEPICSYTYPFVTKEYEDEIFESVQKYLEKHWNE